MPNPASFTQFDAWTARWPGARNYRIFLNVGTSFNGYAMETPEFNTAVAAWINAYAAHWTASGLNLNQIGVHLVDEPASSAPANIVTNWSNAIKAVQPAIKIWSNPIFPDPTVSYAASMFQAVDILTPDRPTFIASTTSDTYRNAFRNAGKTLNFYSCMTAGKRLDPYSYYRLQAWTCGKENAAGMFFWSFDSTGTASSWNEYNAALYNACPLFLDPSSSTVTTGKAMEAIREGVEDYEYLNMLKNRINALAGSGHPKLAAAQTLLNGAADAVLSDTGANTLSWSMSKNRELADQKRIEILDMLENLNNTAMGRTYTMSPTPNYSLCSDNPGDTTQLTDGSYYTGSGSLWTQMPYTVGWQYANPVITIDLGAVKQIKGASFNTAALNSSGVYWPAAIAVAVSSNGSDYTPVGDLVSLSNTENGAPPSGATYNVHCYKTRNLNTSGRYVRLTVTRSGAFVFSDEIEVFEN